MRRNHLLVITLVLTIIMSVIPVTAADNVGVTINGQAIQFTQSSGSPFVDTANRTQVPFRQTMESFGAIVNWDQANQTAIAEKDGIIVKVPIGANYIFKNGIKITNDTVALNKDGRTYLPIRAVLEAFQANVSWNSVSKTVVVSTDAQGNVMSIHFIDVGQADSILIDYGTYEILVDGGNNSDGILVANYIKPYVDGNLELIVATHAHEDHIGGLDNVINAYQADKIIHSDETSTTVTYNDFYEAGISEPNCTFVGDSDMAFDMGNGAQFKVLEMGDGYNNPNENSVVSMIDYNNIEVLLMGDLEGTIENKNLNKYSDIDVLKAGHHGSNTASYQTFLNVTKPEAVIISAGLSNQYGHPHKETMERFLGIGSSVYGTFRSGSIVMTTNGSSYSFNTSTKLTMLDIGAGGTITYPDATTQPNTTLNNPTSNTVTQSEAAYIGNSNTKKFHLLNCRYSSQISVSNIIYFKTRGVAVNNSYVPCKVCNP